MVERLVYTEKVSGSNPLLPKPKKFLDDYELSYMISLFSLISKDL